MDFHSFLLLALVSSSEASGLVTVGDRTQTGWMFDLSRYEYFSVPVKVQLYITHASRDTELMLQSWFPSIFRGRTLQIQPILSSVRPPKINICQVTPEKEFGFLLSEIVSTP